MKTLRLLLIAPFFACTALVAQYAVPVAEEPPAAAPAAVTPPAVQVDPTVAADAVLKAMHYDEMMDKAVDQQKQASLAYTRQMLAKMNLPGTSPQDLKAFEEKAMDAAWAGLNPKDIHANAVRVYDQVFTTDELVAIADFYNSPIGQSITAKQPQVQQKIMAGLRQQMMQVMPKIQQMTRDFSAKQQAKAAQDTAKAAAAKPSVTAAPANPAKPATAAATATLPLK
jgi:hypothetical protein